MDMEPLSPPRSLCFSTMPSALQGRSPRVESVCRRQVEQLVDRLPVVGVWIVYREFPDRERCWIGELRRDRPGFSESELSSIESEVWLTPDLPVATLSRLNCYYVYPLPRHSQANGEAKTEIDFSSPDFSPYNGHSVTASSPSAIAANFKSNDEYLFLWASQVLSPEDETLVKQRSQLLHDYLKAERDRSRQREEIDLLEQALRKAEHQLRNSFALIGLYAENLRLGLPAGPFQEQAIVIRETAAKLSSHLSDLLNCSKQAKMQVRLDDLQVIIRETIQLLQPRLDEKNLQIEFSETSVLLEVDRWQMAQVFENLLSNAIAFSPPEEIITCYWHVFYNEVLVEISDKGPGLSPTDLKEAFTPFYSRRPGGTGLGLAIAKKIILDHQGSIWVQNLSDRGALFSFTLPRTPVFESDFLSEGFTAISE